MATTRLTETDSLEASQTIVLLEQNWYSHERWSNLSDELAETLKRPKFGTSSGPLSKVFEQGITEPEASAGLSGLQIDTGFEPRQGISPTDATDDFDYVVDDTVTKPANNRVLRTLRLLSFKSLSGEPRVDIWDSNLAEVNTYPEVSRLSGIEWYNTRTNPWDPDADDDGLTDGMELVGLTEPMPSGVSLETKHVGPSGLSPLQADSDGDGYWDGWIGVYDVGATDNVILYREHLGTDNDGDGEAGVEGEEIVQKQVQTHTLSKAAPSELGVDIDGDSYREHSNVHIGEQQWETDPTNPSEAPDSSIKLEIDYHADVNTALRTDSWRENIQANYALYGINVEYTDRSTMDVWNQEELNLCPVMSGCPPHLYNTEPFGEEDLKTISDMRRYHQTDAVYMLVGPDAVGGFPHEMGVRWWSDNRKTTEFLALFTEDHDLGDVPSQIRANKDEKMKILTTKTAVHEIGHHLRIGEADDEYSTQTGWKEIYSGGLNDDSIEEVRKPSGIKSTEWSVMSSGSPDGMFIPPTEADYTAFSIEELFTVTTNTPNE